MTETNLTINKAERGLPVRSSAVVCGSDPEQTARIFGLVNNTVADEPGEQRVTQTLVSEVLSQAFTGNGGEAFGRVVLALSHDGKSLNKDEIFSQNPEHAERLSVIAPEFWEQPDILTVPVLLRIFGYTNRVYLILDKTQWAKVPAPDEITRSAELAKYEGNLFPLSGFMCFQGLYGSKYKDNLVGIRYASSRQRTETGTGWNDTAGLFPISEDIHKTSTRAYQWQLQNKLNNLLTSDPKVYPQDNGHLHDDSELQVDFYESLYDAHRQIDRAIEAIEECGISIQTKGVMLDAACGNGIFIRAVATDSRFQHAKCIGLDKNRTLQTEWDAVFDEFPHIPNLEYVTDDINRFDQVPDSSIDLLFLNSGLDLMFIERVGGYGNSPVDVTSFADSAARILKPDGILVINENDLDYLPGKLRKRNVVLISEDDDSRAVFQKRLPA